jgi:hypothetical protein
MSKILLAIKLRLRRRSCDRRTDALRLLALAAHKKILRLIYFCRQIINIKANFQLLERN